MEATEAAVGGSRLGVGVDVWVVKGFELLCTGLSTTAAAVSSYSAHEQHSGA